MDNGCNKGAKMKQNIIKWYHFTFGTLGTLTIIINTYRWDARRTGRNGQLKICYGQHERRRAVRLIKALQLSANVKDTIIGESGYSVLVERSIS